MIENLLEPLVAERFRTDGKYRTGHIRVINPLPGRRVLGVHIPEMRKLARTLAAREDAPELTPFELAERIRNNQLPVYIGKGKRI